MPFLDQRTFFVVDVVEISVFFAWDGMALPGLVDTSGLRKVLPNHSWPIIGRIIPLRQEEICQQGA